MKKTILILLVLWSGIGYSQIRRISGFEPSTGRPGYVINDTLKSLNIASNYLIAVNDTTLAFDSTKTWNISGNAGTNSTNNFIGTTDLISFQIKANNKKRIFIDSAGNIEMYGRYPGTVGSYILRLFDSLNVMRHGFGSNGNQTWILNNGSGAVGSVTISTPNSFPGLAFYNSSVANRSEIRLKSGGGLQFGSLAGSTTPTIQFTMDVTGRFGIGVTSPSAFLHLAANTTTVASIQFTTASANKLTTPVSGALEYAGRFWMQGDGLTLGTATNGSARLDVQSTTQGFLPPRMTAVQAEAISSPAEGLLIYSTTGTGVTITSKGWWGWSGAAWEKLNN